MVTITSELEALIRRCLAQAIVGGNEENITRWAEQLKTLEDRKVQRAIVEREIRVQAYLNECKNRSIFSFINA